MNSDFTNPKQREVLAQFYSNLALAILTFGFIGPFFTSVDFSLIFVVKLFSAIIGTVLFLHFSLRFLR